MSILNLNMMGRFGNQLFQYAHARALAEREGLELRTDPWIGQEIFEGVNEGKRVPGEKTISGYFQTQGDLIYTRSQVRQWFTFKASVLVELDRPPAPLLAHIREGDYSGAGFVVVARESYWRACDRFNLPSDHLVFVEEPAAHGPGPDFVVDFLRLMRAATILRGNSTYSWWAATLGDGRIFSPVIENTNGDNPRLCEFVEGNWPRIAMLPGVSDLHLT